MAITRTGVGTLATGTTSLSVGLPSGSSSGDVLVAVIADHATSGTSATPANWTAVANASATGGRVQVFTALRSVVTGATSFTGLTSRAAGVIASYSGVDLSNILDGTPTARSNASGTTGATAVTTSTTNTLILGAFVSLAANATWTGETTATAGALTEFLDAANSTFMEIALADTTWTSSGSTGASSGTMSSAGANAGALLALRALPFVSDAVEMAFANPPDYTQFLACNKADQWPTDEFERTIVTTNAQPTPGAIYLQSPNATVWAVQVTDAGFLTSATGSGTVNTVVLCDATLATAWQLGIDNNGMLTTTSVAVAGQGTSLGLVSNTGFTSWLLEVTSAGMLETVGLPASSIFATLPGFDTDADNQIPQPSFLSDDVEYDDFSMYAGWHVTTWNPALGGSWDDEVNQKPSDLWYNDKDVDHWQRLIVLPITAFDTDADEQLPRAPWSSASVEYDDHALNIVLPFNIWDHDADHQKLHASSQANLVEYDDHALQITLPAPAWDNDADQQRLHAPNAAYFEDLDDFSMFAAWFIPSWNPALGGSWDDEVNQISQAPSQANLAEYDERALQVILPLTGWDTDADEQLPQLPPTAKFAEYDDHTLQIILPLTGWDVDHQQPQQAPVVGLEDLDDTTFFAAWNIPVWNPLNGGSWDDEVNQKSQAGYQFFADPGDDGADFYEGWFIPPGTWNPALHGTWDHEVNQKAHDPYRFGQDDDPRTIITTNITGGLVTTGQQGFYLQSPNATVWFVDANDSGLLTSQPQAGAVTPIVLADPTFTSAWQLGIDNSGNITTSSVGYTGQPTSMVLVSPTRNTAWTMTVDFNGILTLSIAAVPLTPNLFLPVAVWDNDADQQLPQKQPVFDSLGDADDFFAGWYISPSSWNPALHGTWDEEANQLRQAGYVLSYDPGDDGADLFAAWFIPPVTWNPSMAGNRDEEPNQKAYDPYQFGQDDDPRTIITTNATGNQIGNGSFGQVGFYLQSPNLTVWFVDINDSGLMISQVQSGTVSTVVLADATQTTAWQLGIDNSGDVTTTEVVYSGQPSTLQLLSPTLLTAWNLTVDFNGILASNPAAIPVVWNPFVPLAVWDNNDLMLPAPKQQAIDASLGESDNFFAGWYIPPAAWNPALHGTWDAEPNQKAYEPYRFGLEDDVRTIVTTNAVGNSFGAIGPTGFYLQSPNGTTWFIDANDSGILVSTVQSGTVVPIVLADAATQTTAWQLGIDNNGDLTTTSVAYAGQPTSQVLVSFTANTAWFVTVDFNGILQTSIGAVPRVQNIFLPVAGWDTDGVHQLPQPQPLKITDLGESDDFFAAWYNPPAPWNPSTGGGWDTDHSYPQIVLPPGFFTEFFDTVIFPVPPNPTPPSPPANPCQGVVIPVTTQQAIAALPDVTLIDMVVNAGTNNWWSYCTRRYAAQVMLQRAITYQQSWLFIVNVMNYNLLIQLKQMELPEFDAFMKTLS